MYIIEINIYSKKVYSQGDGNFTTNKGEAKQFSSKQNAISHLAKVASMVDVTNADFKIINIKEK